MSDRPEEILAAAAQIVSEHDWEAVSVRAVAARAGIGASTLRHYFPTQRDLYDALVGRLLRSRLDDLRIRDTSVPARTRLTECVGQFLPADDGGRTEIEALVATYATAVGPTATEQGARLLEVMGQQARAQTEGWIVALLDEGAMSVRIEPSRLTTILLSLVDGLCLEMVTPGTQLSPAGAHSLLAEVVDQLVDLPGACTG